MTKLHPVINEAMRSNGLTHDQWATCLTVLGALCDVVSAWGDENEIPDSVGYRSPVFASWKKEDADLGERLSSFWEDGGSGEFDLQRDLVVAVDRSIDPKRFVPEMEPLDLDQIGYAIRVLDRYADLLKQAGEDY